MKTSGLFLAVAVAAAAAWTPALCQTGGSAGGAIIHEAPGPNLPNLSGKWINATPMAALRTADGKAPPLNAKGRALLAKHKADPNSDPIKLCQLQGEPRLLYTAYPFLILQYQKHVDFVHQVNHTFRLVKFDAKLDPDADPIWLGNGSAHWDGKTLVIDSINYNDKTWLDYQGLPHGEKLKTEERYTLSDDGQHINGTVRIEDPDYYTRPWTTAFTLNKQPGFAIAESVCEDDHQM